MEPLQVEETALDDIMLSPIGISWTWTHQNFQETIPGIHSVGHAYPLTELIIIKAIGELTREVIWLTNFIELKLFTCLFVERYYIQINR